MEMIRAYDVNDTKAVEPKLVNKVGDKLAEKAGPPPHTHAITMCSKKSGAKSLLVDMLDAV